jgi:methyl-galactoside transport system substrate-binding protein
MKIVKKLLIVIIISFMIIDTLEGCTKIKNYRNSQGINSNPVKISVFAYKIEDDFIAGINKNLEKIQAENPQKVQFTFYDSKNSQDLQNELIDKAINEGTDLFFVSLVDVNAAELVLNKIKQNNAPVILYNREPLELYPVKSYSKALYIGNDSKEGGILQGKILVEEWNTNRELIDKNNDGIMQYVVLSGERENKDARSRTNYSIKTVEDAGIKMEELALRVANFDKRLARSATESLFFRYGNNMEVINSNDDTMAIGAIEALQGLGYNKGDKNRTITVIGFDAIPEARNLISQEFMAGTVIQSPHAMAEALYKVGMNLKLGKNPLEGTNYQFDGSGVAIRIPYEGILMDINN